MKNVSETNENTMHSFRQKMYCWTSNKSYRKVFGKTILKYEIFSGFNIFFFCFSFLNGILHNITCIFFLFIHFSFSTNDENKS